MGKLHEVLAVESSLKGAAEKMLAETKKTFDGRNAAYTGASKTYQPLKADDNDQPPAESKPVGYTVAQKIAYLTDAWVKFLDALYQKEKGNTHAQATVVATLADDTTVEIAKDVPATVLLNLETRLEQLRGVYDEIPTLDPNFTWSWNKEEGAWVTKEHRTQRTKKVKKVLTAAPATDKHPAQVAMYDEDEVVGYFTSVSKSGAMPIAVKSQLLARLDILSRAVKTARQRANDVEVKPMKIGRALFDFIHKDLL